LSISPLLLLHLFSVINMSTVHLVLIFYFSSWKHYDCTTYAPTMVFQYILALALEIPLQCHRLKQLSLLPSNILQSNIWQVGHTDF
jgi:hypothetical protein